MSTFKLQALGTHWIFRVGLDEVSSIKQLSIKLVTEFENNYSRFSKDSLLSQLNDRRRLDQPSDELVQMLTLARDLYKTTEGVFDISIGGELEANGYGLDIGGERASNLLDDLQISQDKIVLDGKSRLDLGGFGKGWLVDKLVQLLLDQAVESFVINAGGDIYVHGREQLLIEDPRGGEKFIGRSYVENGSLSASSNGLRSWQHDGSLQTHIPDANGQVSSAHVSHSKTAVSDALATTLLIVDRQKATQLCLKYQADFMLTYQVDDAVRVYRSPGFSFSAA